MPLWYAVNERVSREFVKVFVSQIWYTFLVLVAGCSLRSQKGPE